jgi:Uma2 family endonuclease
MNRLEEIKQSLREISADERGVILEWLEERLENELPGLSVAEPASAYAHTLPPYMTVDEYFAFEEMSELRHEYVNGVVYAMSSSSVAHAMIAEELSSALKAHLRVGPCRVFTTTIALRISSATDEFVYHPDLIVACNQEGWGKNYMSNPKLVAEVLSPSTKAIDRREKAMAYRRVSSIEEYVLLEQDEHRVIVHRRDEDWKPQVLAGPQAILELRSISLAVPLAQIYAGTLDAD